MNLPNSKQIYEYLTGKHPDINSEVLYKVSKNTVGNHIKAGKLSPARGGGFTKKSIDTYARNHLPTKSGPAPVKADQTDSGAQERRVNADADLKSIEAKRKKLLYGREVGKYISILTFERELAERWQAVSLLLSNFSYEVGPEVAEIFGGEEQARELVELCDGDPDRAEEITRFMSQRVPDFTALFRQRVRESLGCLASGEWYTEDARAAWEKWQKNRVEGSRNDTAALISLVGGDLGKINELLELFEISERADVRAE